MPRKDDKQIVLPRCRCKNLGEDDRRKFLVLLVPSSSQLLPYTTNSCQGLKGNHVHLQRQAKHGQDRKLDDSHSNHHFHSKFGLPCSPATTAREPALPGAHSNSNRRGHRNGCSQTLANTRAYSGRFENAFTRKDIKCAGGPLAPRLPPFVTPDVTTSATTWWSKSWAHTRNVAR